MSKDRAEAGAKMTPRLSAENVEEPISQIDGDDERCVATRPVVPTAAIVPAQIRVKAIGGKVKCSCSKFIFRSSTCWILHPPPARKFMWKLSRTWTCGSRSLTGSWSM